MKEPHPSRAGDGNPAVMPQHPMSGDGGRGAGPITIRRVRFETPRVPRNLSNAHLPNVRHRSEGPSRWSETKDWREWSITQGNAVRNVAGWQKAEPAKRVRVVITFYRVGKQMDKDGKYAAAKPVLDGLKVVWLRKRAFKGGPVIEHPGSGLIYDDDDEHLPDDMYAVRQVRVRSFVQQRTVVEVERFP